MAVAASKWDMCVCMRVYETKMEIMTLGVEGGTDQSADNGHAVVHEVRC